MKSLYDELNGNYVTIGDIIIPALVSVNTNYEIDFGDKDIMLFGKSP